MAPELVYLFCTGKEALNFSEMACTFATFFYVCHLEVLGLIL